MGNNHEPVVSHSQPAVVEPISTTKPSRTSPAAPTADHNLDATRASALMLRRLAERVGYALVDDGTPRIGHVVVAASELAALVREVSSLARISKVNWAGLTHELSSGLIATKQLNAQLGEAPQIRAELAGALHELQAVVPAASWAAASGGTHATVFGPTSDHDRIELARNAMAAARAQVQAFRKMSPGDDKQQAIALCVPLPLHFNVASDAARSIADRRQRDAALANDVERVSSEMEHIASFLSMDKKLTWDRTFAAAFDAENALRKSVGKGPMARPYSGTIDPQQAITMVNAVAKGAAAPDAATTVFDTPQQAMEGVAAGIERVFAKQQIALDEVAKHLAEPPRPPPFSKSLVDFAVSLAISGVAGALGNVASNAFRKLLDTNKVGRVLDAHIMNLLPKEDQEMLTQDLLKNGALGRLAAADAAKDMTKEVIKSGLNAALKGISKKPLNTTQPLAAFVKLQRDSILDAIADARVLFIKQGPAISQADLHVLNALHQALHGEIAEAAETLQYDHSMREWQNFKAKLDAGPAPDDRRASNSTKQVDGEHAGDRDARVDADAVKDRVNGVLEVRAEVSGDPAHPGVTLRSLKLNGGEPAAIRHFRHASIPLREVGINQRYELQVWTYNNMERLLVGVGPDRGLQLASVSQEEMRLLKVYAAGDRVTSQNWYRAQLGEYDHVTDSAALRVLHKLIARLAEMTTDRLEG